jgi:hypothetical protein
MKTRSSSRLPLPSRPYPCKAHSTTASACPLQPPVLPFPTPAQEPAASAKVVSMLQVPADTSTAFQRRLDQAQVPADQRQDYQKWVCSYLDFCIMGAGVPRPGGGDAPPELLAQDVFGLPAMGGEVRVFDPQQRFGAIAAPRTVGRGSAWLPMGCTGTLVMRLPDDYHQAARDALAHRPQSACGPRRRLAVASP